MFASIELITDYCLKQNMGESGKYKGLKQWNYLAADKINKKNKYGENVSGFEVVKVVENQCNLVDNQLKSEIIYTFTSSKSYVCKMFKQVV